MSLPFSQVIKGSEYTRTFHEGVKERDLLWHRDAEDRLVKSELVTNWKIQIENELPQCLNKEIFIPRLQWHRLIKGSSNLTLKIIKL